MSTLVAFTTTLPTQGEDRGKLCRQVAERDQPPAQRGRYGYHLLNAVTVTAAEYVTVVETLAKDAE